MNKIISFAFLAVFVFYGFHRCSKLHPAQYFERIGERAPFTEPKPVPPEGFTEYPVPSARVEPARFEPEQVAEPTPMESRPLEGQTQPGSDGSMDSPVPDPEDLEPEVSDTERRVQEQPDGNERFACTGKTRCHQMASCEEARYYLEHCPSVQIDGDGDGQPCEDMCGH